MILTQEQRDTLVSWLPRGEAQYTRNHETGAWDVKIYSPGTVESLFTVATNMDKSVACWIMHALNATLETQHKKEN